MSNQGARQASVRAVTGTAFTYEGDWMALFDSSGIPAGDFNGRFLAWLNTRIPESKTNLPDAMASYAINIAGVSCWNEVREIGGLPPPIPGPLDFVSSDSGTSLNVVFDLAAPIAALGVIIAFEGTLTNITANHGGEDLTLVRLDINATEKTATAMFIGNNLTIASDTLAISLVGGAVGKAWIGRINDDYGYTSIASGWSDGGFGTAAQSPTYTVSGVDGTGRSLSVWGGTNTTGRAGFVMPLANNTTQFSASVVGGDRVAVTGWTLITGWSEAGGVYTHTGPSSGLSKVLSPNVAGPIGFDADVTIAANSYMTVIMVPVVGTPTQRSIYGPYTGKWAAATEDALTFQSLAVMATGDTTITNMNYITSPRFLQGVISRSNGTVSNGTNITWGSVNVDDFVNTNIEVHQSGVPPTEYISAAIGDSITAQGSFAAGSLSNLDRGYVTAYNTISNGAIVLPPENNKAVSGRTAAQCLTAIDTDLNAAEANQSFTHVWLMAGINSITTGSSAAGLQTTLTSMLDNIVGVRGKICLFMTITPADDIVVDPPEETVRQTVNTWIRSQNGTRGGKVIVIDMEAAINDGANLPVPNSTTDGKHPTSYGAYLMGSLAATTLNPMYPPFPIPTDYTTGNLLTNGPLVGAGGTLNGGTSGVSPNGWQFRAINGNTAGRVGSKNGSDEFVVTMNITSGSNQAWRLQQDITTGFVAGDRIFAEVKLQVGDNPLGLDTLTLNTSFTGTGVVNPSISTNGGGIPADAYFNGRGEYIMRTPVITVNGTGLTLSTWLQGGKASATPVANHVVTIKGMRVVKV